MNISNPPANLSLPHEGEHLAQIKDAIDLGTQFSMPNDQAVRPDDSQESTADAFPSHRDGLALLIGKGAADATLSFLGTLEEDGDKPELFRDVLHLTFFQTKKDAKHFCEWAHSRGYQIISIWHAKKHKFGVRFKHCGQASFESIAMHEALLFNFVAAYGGTYDGWETSTEKRQLSKSEIEAKTHIRLNANPEDWEIIRIQEIPPATA